MSRMELALRFQDSYPLFRVRKSIQLWMAGLRTICYKIITNTLFDALIMIIILLNS